MPADSAGKGSDDECRWFVSASVSAKPISVSVRSAELGFVRNRAVAIIHAFRTAGCLSAAERRCY